MTKYTIKYVSGTNYNLYEDGTLVTDFTVFTSASSAYFVIDLNGSVPTTIDAFTIVDSNSDAVISATALTDELEDGATFKGAWGAGTIPNTFTSFTKLEGVSMDESQISFLMSKIKNGSIKELKTGDVLYDLGAGVYKLPSTISNIYIQGTVGFDQQFANGLVMASGTGTGRMSCLILYPDTSNSRVRVYRMSISNNSNTGNDLIVDNLTSTVVDSALSANQGRVLNNNKLANANLQAGNGITITTTGTNANTVKTVSLDTTITDQIDAKQDELVSGTNIKTINSTSLLGSGDISIDTSVAAGSITGATNTASSVGTTKLAFSTVGTKNLRTSAVSTDKIASKAVTSEKIDWTTLNTSWTTLNTVSSSKPATVAYKKTGNTVWVTVTNPASQNYTMNANTTITLGTLPTGYRPDRTIRQYAAHGGIIVTVDGSGNVELDNWGGASVTNNYVAANIVFTV